MTPAEAARLLELPADATPDQVEARFNELRARLEEKIGKAPTPGLKAKYRETLDEITTAFETLTLAADSSALPVLKRENGEVRKEKGSGSEAGGGRPEAGRSGPAPSSFHPAPATRRKSGREFGIVAIIAVVVLGAGGWFVLKTRAEKAEQARIAAATQAEAGRLAAEAQARAEAEKAEQQRLAQLARDQAEQARLAAEAEKERLQKLAGRLRGELAELGVTWEAFTREERTAERRLGELKSDLRSLRDAPQGKIAEAQAMVAAQQDYYDWLSDTLVKHPARLARVRAEQLLSSGQIEEAGAAVAEVRSAQAMLDEQMASQRRALLDLDGTVVIRTHDAAGWSFEDAFGRKHAGTGSTTLDDVAVGPIRVRLTLPGWPDREETLLVRAAIPAELDSPYVTHALTLTSEPAGVSVVDATGRPRGITPVTLAGLPPGRQELTLRKEGFYEQPLRLDLPEGGASTREVTMVARPLSPDRPRRWSMPARVTVESRGEFRSNSGRSTGAYAKNPTNSHNATFTVEEWDFSEPDATGEWQRVERRFIRQEGNTNLVTTGTVVVYRRTPQGTWQGEFVRGGVTNAAYRDAIVAHFNPTAWDFSDKVWPPAGTPVGGTWQIKAADFSYLAPLSKNPDDRVTGRLLAFQREAASDWVDLEFGYQMADTTGDAKAWYKGTYRFRVDLAGFPLSVVSDMEITNTISAGIAGTLHMDSTHRSTMTIKVRGNPSAP